MGKINVLDKFTAEKIAAAVKAEVVQVIGGVMVFYRRSEQKVPKDKRIKLVK